MRMKCFKLVKTGVDEGKDADNRVVNTMSYVYKKGYIYSFSAVQLQYTDKANLSSKIL